MCFPLNLEIWCMIVCVNSEVSVLDIQKLLTLYHKLNSAGD